MQKYNGISDFYIFVFSVIVRIIGIFIYSSNLTHLMVWGVSQGPVLWIKTVKK